MVVTKDSVLDIEKKFVKKKCAFRDGNTNSIVYKGANKMTEYELYKKLLKTTNVFAMDEVLEQMNEEESKDVIRLLMADIVQKILTIQIMNKKDYKSKIERFYKECEERRTYLEGLCGMCDDSQYDQVIGRLEMLAEVITDLKEILGLE